MEKRNKFLIAFSTVVVAVAVIAGVSYYAGVWPPSDDATGAIGVATKYRAEQMSQDDIILKNPEMQKLMQNDEFQRMIQSKSFRKAMAHSNIEAALRDPGFIDALRHANMAELRDNELLQPLYDGGAIGNLGWANVAALASAEEFTSAIDNGDYDAALGYAQLQGVELNSAEEVEAIFGGGTSDGKLFFSSIGSKLDWAQVAQLASAEEFTSAIDNGDYDAALGYAQLEGVELNSADEVEQLFSGETGGSKLFFASVTKLDWANVAALASSEEFTSAIDNGDYDAALGYAQLEGVELKSAEEVESIFGGGTSDGKLFFSSIGSKLDWAQVAQLASAEEFTSAVDNGDYDAALGYAQMEGVELKSAEEIETVFGGGTSDGKLFFSDIGGKLDWAQVAQLASAEEFTSAVSSGDYDAALGYAQMEGVELKSAEEVESIFGGGTSDGKLFFSSIGSKLDWAQVAQLASAEQFTSAVDNGDFDAALGYASEIGVALNNAEEIEAVFGGETGGGKLYFAAVTKLDWAQVAQLASADEFTSAVDNGDFDAALGYASEIGVNLNSADEVESVFGGANNGDKLFFSDIGGKLDWAQVAQLASAEEFTSAVDNGDFDAALGYAQMQGVELNSAEEIESVFGGANNGDKLFFAGMAQVMEFLNNNPELASSFAEVVSDDNLRDKLAWGSWGGSGI